MTDSDRPFHAIARAACDRAVEKATSLGVKATVVVLDSTFNVAASVRMDGAYASAFVVGRAKAWTSLNFGAPSRVLAERMSADAKTMIPSIEPNILFLGGGELLILDGVVSGAVGVSGGSVDQDVEIATAAVERGAE